MILIKLTLLVLFLVTPLTAKYHKHIHKERYYQHKINKELNGVEEYRIKGVRVDILTKKYAIECDFATGSKSYESIGQSLYYSIITKKKPGVVLISENPKLDLKYILRTKTICREYNIYLWIYRDNKLINIYSPK